MTLTVDDNDLDSIDALIVAHVWALEEDFRRAKLTGQFRRAPGETEREARLWRERLGRFRDAFGVAAS